MLYRFGHHAWSVLAVRLWSGYNRLLVQLVAGSMPHKQKPESADNTLQQTPVYHLAQSLGCWCWKLTVRRLFVLVWFSTPSIDHWYLPIWFHIWCDDVMVCAKAKAWSGLGTYVPFVCVGSVLEEIVGWHHSESQTFRKLSHRTSYYHSKL